MNRPDERDGRIRELEERLSRLSEASLHITGSLDFDTVLQKVLDSARDLSGAQYGVIVTMDERGGGEAIVTSGISEEQHRQLVDLPGGGKVFEHFTAIVDPLRVDNYGEYASSAGFNGSLPMQVWAGLSAPIRHWGQTVGFIMLGHGSEDRQFSLEDEETLVMFSSQAAIAIANARRHRDERQARADLETLMDTSPVGVVVFDVATGAVKSLNREARRIVDCLRNPGQSPEDLLDVVAFRRASRREISLREFPVAEVLKSGETLRAEEIVISVPDGRSVTLLINATPIVSGEGAVESLVVTLQDMAEVQELERMRAEFLAMVSHELRAPLTSIKGSASTVLDSSVDLDPAVVRQFFRIIEDQADHMHYLVSDLLDVARIETGTLAVNPEPAEVAVLVDQARNAFKSAGGRNDLSIDIEPDLPLVTADKRRIVQVLSNLLANAARHSPESSVIGVSAVQDDVYVCLSVADDGRGILPESLPHLFRKFSRVPSEEQGGDTGLGLAICKGIVEAHGGRIWAESDGPGLGARFAFTLPTVEDAASGGASGGPPVAVISTRESRGDSGKRMRILAVDDNPNDLRYIRDTLVEAGYAPIVTGNPEDAVRLMEEERPELALLDLMLPGSDGIELMKDIFGVAEVPVIFLSAYGREEVVARAFEMGAFDYVVKPFSPTELAARINAALRRRITVEPSEPYVLGDLTIDYARRRASLDGRQVQLTPTEYAMLAELSAHAGRVLTHQHLLERVWRDRSGHNLRPMRTMVSKLRRKLGDDAANPTYIFTESGVGFRMPRGESGEEETAAPVRQI
ncbi:MAG: response regulator [Acidimicrobiia bacterium]|nr:response regulator [Acidimicrobiia bacterium]MYB73798.1 response regulator [Acidimicrobiia bacterium]MYH99822.1 response regulator [Acidimicrobiia bacterium]